MFPRANRTAQHRIPVYTVRWKPFAPGGIRVAPAAAQSVAFQARDDYTLGTSQSQIMEFQEPRNVHIDRFSLAAYIPRFHWSRALSASMNLTRRIAAALVMCMRATGP